MVKGHLRGQDSMEYMAMLGIALLVALLGFSLFEFWPEYNRELETQRSDDYWAAARPFSVKTHAMVPNQLLLELTNEDPITMEITKLYVNGKRLDIFKHPDPFTWDGTSVCAGGTCSLFVRPGKTVIITTENFTAPENPCIDSSTFQYGKSYELDVKISYYANPDAPDVGNIVVVTPTYFNQTGTKPLSGICSPRA